MLSKNKKSKKNNIKSKKNNIKSKKNNIKSKRNISIKIMMDIDLLKIKELLNTLPENNINDIEKINYFVEVMENLNLFYKQYGLIFPYVDRQIRETMYIEIVELRDIENNLKENYLKGINIEDTELYNYNFYSCNLEGSSFSNVTMQPCNFIDCNLNNAKFDDETEIGDTYFSDASCRETKFKNTRIIKSYFDNTDLAYAEFDKVEFEEVDLSVSKNYRLATYDNTIINGEEIEEIISSEYENNV